MKRDEPIRPLTDRQRQIADLLGRGWSYKRIGAHLDPPIEETTVARHVVDIAMLLDNPDDLAAGTRVMLWAAHRRWRLALTEGSLAA